MTREPEVAVAQIVDEEHNDVRPVARGPWSTRLGLRGGPKAETQRVWHRCRRATRGSARTRALAPSVEGHPCQAGASARVNANDRATSAHAWVTARQTKGTPTISVRHAAVKAANLGVQNGDVVALGPNRRLRSSGSVICSTLSRLLSTLTDIGIVAVQLLVRVIAYGVAASA